MFAAQDVPADPPEQQELLVLPILQDLQGLRVQLDLPGQSEVGPLCLWLSGSHNNLYPQFELIRAALYGAALGCCTQLFNSCDR